MPLLMDKIIVILREVGNLKEVGHGEDFYDAGFSSVNALTLLFELESAFQVSIPDDRFIATRTAEGLRKLIDDLQANGG